MIVLLALALGVVAGWIRGGKLRNLEQLRIRYAPGILALFVVQAFLRAPFWTPGWLSVSNRVGLWSASVLGLTVMALANRRIRGFLVVTIGLLLNLVAVGLNGAMPLSQQAATRLGASVSQIAAGLQNGFYVLVSPDTRLWFLGDVLPVPTAVPGIASVLSAGDLLMLVGVAIVVADGMLPGKDSIDSGQVAS